MENNIQDQLERVAKLAEGTVEEEEVLEEDLEEGTDEDEKADEPDKDESGSNQEDETSKDDERKQASAFAAMRKRLKEFEEENKTLKEQLEGKPPKSKEQEQEPKKEESELQKRLLDAEKQIQELRAKEQQKQITNELVELKTRFNLNNDQLVEFADELEKRGYQIGDTRTPLADMYTMVYHDKIVQNRVSAEVERVKKELMSQYEDVPPGTGPKSPGAPSGKQKDNIRATLARVAAKLE